MSVHHFITPPFHIFVLQLACVSNLHALTHVACNMDPSLKIASFCNDGKLMIIASGVNASADSQILPPPPPPPPQKPTH